MLLHSCASYCALWRSKKRSISSTRFVLIPRCAHQQQNQTKNKQTKKSAPQPKHGHTTQKWDETNYKNAADLIFFWWNSHLELLPPVHVVNMDIPTLKFTVPSKCEALGKNGSVTLKPGFVCLGGKKNTTKLFSLEGKVGKYTIHGLGFVCFCWWVFALLYYGKWQWKSSNHQFGENHFIFLPTTLSNAWQLFVTFLGWLSDPLNGKVTSN